ncbi:MAG: glycoside hydrolase family 26 protein [Actinomycetes bacterium]
MAELKCDSELTPLRYRIGWAAVCAVVVINLSACDFTADSHPAADDAPSPVPTSPASGRLAALERQLAHLQAEAKVTDGSVSDLIERKASLERQIAAISGQGSITKLDVTEKIDTHKVVVPISTFQHCYDFRWQQDAQAVYEADLMDPYGLDGPPGPANDDGLACTDLPSDPHRPPSVPVNAYVVPTPTAPARAQLVDPKQVRFGMYTLQAPFDMSELDLVSSRIGKRPDSVGFFLGWDQGFRPDAVTRAWQEGMLPMLTWESLPNLPSAVRTTDDSDYEMSKILNGQFDAYIDQFALDIKQLGLPLVIRLDQEMNADYYPWSDTMSYNERGEYVQMWRYVVDRFRAIGADKYVIWHWTPNRVDDIPQKQIASFYPGDDYVDWVGIDGYWRNKSRAYDFAVTYGRTLALLRALTDKPIFFGEVGATEAGGHKVAWINSFFAALPMNPDIIGFAWFNLTVAIGSGSSTVSNDWRINSTDSAAAAFAAGISDVRYGVPR